MGEAERDRFVSAALVRTGYLRSQGGEPSAGMSDAISRYQADNDLIPNGRIDFDLYYRMLAYDARVPSDKPVAQAPAAQAQNAASRVTPPPVSPSVAATAPVPSPEPPRLTMSTPRGPRPTYHVGETMVLSVQPTNDAYVYCFYQDSTGTVSRIFPNRFQPDPLLHAGVQTEIPPAGAKSFAIRFDKPGVNEAVACLGADREIGLRLPDKLKAQDLEPLPVNGLDEVATRFREIPGARVDDARLGVEVTR